MVDIYFWVSARLNQVKFVFRHKEPFFTRFPNSLVRVCHLFPLFAWGTSEPEMGTPQNLHISDINKPHTFSKHNRTLRETPIPHTQSTAQPPERNIYHTHPHTPPYLTVTHIPHTQRYPPPLKYPRRDTLPQTYNTYKISKYLLIIIMLMIHNDDKKIIYFHRQGQSQPPWIQPQITQLQCVLFWNNYKAFTTICFQFRIITKLDISSLYSVLELLCFQRSLPSLSFSISKMKMDDNDIDI